MYYFLTEAVSSRIIHELRQFWAYNPEYRDDLVDNIQGSYSFRERPQQAIIVKMGGTNHQRLSPDNFVGTLRSYVCQAKVGGSTGLSFEWVREDAIAIQDNNSVFPSAPGIYIITITALDDCERIITFEVQQCLDVTREGVMMTSVTEGQLAQPYIPGTLFLREFPTDYVLVEGADYTANPTTGEITLLVPLAGGCILTAEYRYKGLLLGPFYVRQNRAHHKAIPGVLVAFGRRTEVGDQTAVIVTRMREPAAKVYGGRWDNAIEMEIMARDVHSQREIADQTVMYINGILRSRLAPEGLEILDVSMGGEIEEVNDETADNYFYNTTISMTLQTDWEIYVPIVGRIRQFTGGPEFGTSGSFVTYTDPFFATKSRTMEKIS